MNADRQKERVRRIKEVNRIAKEQGLTAHDLAEIAGVSRATIQRWVSVSDEMMPNTLQAEKLFQACDISPAWMMMGIGPVKLSDLKKLCGEE